MFTLLQINTVVNYGSTGRIAEGIGEVVMDLGWDSYIAYGRNKQLSSSKLIKIGTNWDIIGHITKTRLFDKHGFGSRNATKKLVARIDQIKPDIIHLHNIHGYYLNIEILFRYLHEKDIPVVWTLHDCWPFTGHCTYFDFVGCEKWKVECNNCPQKYEYPASFLFDRSKKNYNIKKELFSSLSRLTIVPVSNWMHKMVQQSYLKEFPSQVIKNGISNVFKPHRIESVQSKYNLKGRSVILGVASDWIPRKGLKDFIELSKRVNANTTIVLVGLTKKQNSTLPNNIIGIMRTENIDELIDLYSLADVFVNPTWEDNFPTTNLEALACGTPVITYNTGGSPEAIDLRTGIVIAKGDIGGLIKAITEVLAKGKEFYSQSCIERTQRLFNKNDRFQDYVNLFNIILSNKLV